MCLILSENWTMTSARDLPALVRWAREAEDAGFDSVMISEHIVLGRSAGANGVMANPRVRPARQPGPGDAVAARSCCCPRSRR
jgi:alkanesulfonate monooxygenase SsuD/methylene tetrahydromethanopterin reductase-like flavin-dependent oxidoreductase (luciferase family)